MCRSRRLSEGWVTLSADFRRKGASPTNRCWCQKTRVWYQNICSASFSFVTMHASDGRTDRQTDRRTDGHNFDSNTEHCITCSRTVIKLVLLFENRSNFQKEFFKQRYKFYNFFVRQKLISTISDLTRHVGQPDPRIHVSLM